MKLIRLSKLALAALLSLSLFSCNFFTNSLGTWAKRDVKSEYNKKSSEELVKLLDDDNLATDKETSAAVLEALGAKSDLKSLPVEQKEKVLDLMTTTTLSIGTLIDSVQDILSQDNPDASSVISSILECVSPADTAATLTILGDTETLDNADPLTIMMAATSVVAQIAKENDLANKTSAIASEIQEVIANGKNTDAAVDAVLGAAVSPEAKKDLKVVFDSLQHLASNRAEDIGNIELPGGIKFSDLLAPSGT